MREPMNGEPAKALRFLTKEPEGCKLLCAPEGLEPFYRLQTHEIEVELRSAVAGSVVPQE